MKLADRQLLENPELERAIAEDPYDEERWIVLEDWLLEQDDPRAILVRLEKAGRVEGATRARRRLYPQLFGDDIGRSLYRMNWRAGYLRECTYAGGDVAHLRTLSQAPAATLLRAIKLSLGSDGTRDAFAVLATAVFRTTLADLTVSNVDAGVPRVAPAALVHFTRLRRLALRGAYLTDGEAEVGRVRQLVLAPTRSDLEHLEPMVKAATFPDVDELLVDLSHFAEPSLPRAAQLSLFAGRFAPRLARFELRNGDARLARDVIDAIANSSLLPQLTAVNLGPIDGHMTLRARHGDRFDHVAVTLPADY